MLEESKGTSQDKNHIWKLCTEKQHFPFHYFIE